MAQLISLSSITLFILMGFFQNPCLAQNNNTIYYVWAPDSTNLFESPSLHSPVITRLAYGDSLYFIQTAEMSTSPLFRLSENYIQDTTQFARWFKVKLNLKEGYILENSVSQLKPMWNEPLHDYLNKTYGLNDSLKFKREVIYDSKVFFEEVDSLSYNNNVSYVKAIFDGCYNYSYHFEKITLLNAYLLLSLDTYFEETYFNMGSEQMELSRYLLQLDKIEENVYFFRDMFTQNGIKLIVHSGGAITIEYYYCM